MRLDEIVQRLDEYVGMFNKEGKLDADYMEFRLACLNSREGAHSLARALLKKGGRADVKEAAAIARSMSSHYANTFFLEMIPGEKVVAKAPNVDVHHGDAFTT